jgi:tripartite-type tricarboxylate transporter receptor subunit TctC
MKMKIMFFSLFFVMISLFNLPRIGSAKSFYDGKVITLVVATKPGGGYDFYGRLIGKYMQKYLPGSTVIIKNVPGAGHIIGTNFIYNAKADGLTFGTFNRAIPFTQIVGLKGVKFDVRKMSWLGSASPEIYCFIVTNKFENLNDVLTADKLTLATGGPGNLSTLAPMLFIQMASLSNVNAVGGYHGSEAELAMMRGEVDGQFASFTSMTQFIENGYGRPVMFIAKKQPNGYAHVPLIGSVISDKNYQTAIDLLLTVNLLGRPFAGPPGIPADRLTILRDAFRKTCQDPDLVKFAENSRKSVDYTGGEDAQNLVTDIMNLPSDIVQLLKQSYGVKAD